MISLRCILDFISNRELKNNKEEDISFLSSFGQIAFDFISFLFKEGWDSLKMDINNKMLQKLIINEFSTKVSTMNKEKNWGERWHSGRDPHPYVLCLPQTYLRLWVQFLSSPLY